MSSREIAELTGKTHFNVCADIRNMLAQLGVGELKFQSSYLSKQNKQVTEYLLPRRECEILVCGYDVGRRAAVIDRWLELETKQRQLPKMTPAQMIAAKVYCRSRDDRLIGRPVMTVTKNPCVYDLIVSGEILRWYVCRPDEHHIHTGGNQ